MCPPKSAERLSASSDQLPIVQYRVKRFCSLKPFRFARSLGEGEGAGKPELVWVLAREVQQSGRVLATDQAAQKFEAGFPSLCRVIWLLRYRVQWEVKKRAE